MSKLYRSRGKFYKVDNGEWVFWCVDSWVYSEDANEQECVWHKDWSEDLKLVGNNFRLK